MVYLITYDLHKLKNYKRLDDRLLALKNCIRPLDSFWIVDTPLSLNQLKEYILQSVDNDDWFYVTTISSPGDGRLAQSSWDWLNQKFIAAPGKLGLKPLEPQGASLRLGKLPLKPR